MTRVVVLGAGIAGLTIAFRRRSAGETVVLEAAPEAGGSIRTLRENGLVLEAGPNTLRASEAAERLISDLGLEAEALAADSKLPRFIVRGGRARAIVPGPAGLFTTALSAGEKGRVLAEPLVKARPASADDESVDSFFRRRFGAGVARFAAGPIVSGVYADDPATLSVRSAFPRLWEAEARSGSVLKDFLTHRPAGPRFHPRTLGFQNGLATLPEALVKKLEGGGVRIVTGTRAVSIEGPLFGPGATCRFRVGTADGRTFEADTIVSTIEAPVLAGLLADRLPRSGARLAALASSPLAVVAMAFRTGSAAAPRGFGTLIPRCEGFRSLGILILSSLFPARTPDGVVLLTAMLGGALDPALAAAPEEELVRIAEEEARRLHPGLADRIHARLVRWKAAIPRLPLGHHTTVTLLEKDLEELNGPPGEPRSLVVTGPWRDGVALGDRITRGEAIGGVL